MKSLRLCSFLLFAFLSSVGATTYNSDGSQADVQAKINLAADGDTVTLPSGSFTWTTTVTNTKSLTISGAGIDVTTVTANISGGRALTNECSGGKFVTIFGITFNTVSLSSGILGVGTANCGGNPIISFRVHDCKFNCSPSNGLSAAGNNGFSAAATYGVIDHCTFTQTLSTGGGMILVQRDNTFSVVNTYHTPQSLGDQNAVYIEDCTFNNPSTADSVIDCYAGMKYVARHNTVYNNTIGNHGYDSANRSARSFEIYQNTFLTSGTNGRLGIHIRGGTGVVWSNTFDSGYSGFMAIDLCASDPTTMAGGSRPQADAPSALWGSPRAGPGLVGPPPINLPTGSNPDDGNSVTSGNSKGYPCLDQPGRGSFPTGNPGNWPKVTTGYASNFEALDPIYQWGNNFKGNTSPTCGTNLPNTVYYVQPNRDYYDNVQKPNYTPLQYPHPLTQLAAPTNLRVVAGP
jgi:hypothetical protein